MFNATLRLGYLILFFFSYAMSVRTQTVEIRSQQFSNLAGSAEAGNLNLAVSIGGQPSPIPITSRDVGDCNVAVFSGHVYTIVDTLTLPPSVPVIFHTPVEMADAGRELVINAEGCAVDAATLHFRRGGESAFRQTDMAVNGDGALNAVIPGNEVGSKSLEYFIEANNANGVDREPASGFYCVVVNLPDEGVVRDRAQPGGRAQTDYHLVSLPARVLNADPSAVLEDDLGPYDIERWRFFDLDRNRIAQGDLEDPYKEFGQTSNMTPGKAFWLIVRDAGQVIDTGAGLTLSTCEPFSVPLNAEGYTFVGNPFDFAIARSSLRLNDGSELDIREFRNGQFTALSGNLEPFEGYLILAESATDLVIAPNTSSSLLSASEKGSQLNESIEPLWAIDIHATARAARDTLTRAAVYAEASVDRDKWDSPEALLIGEYVSVYFLHPEWQSVFSRFTVDARPEPPDGNVWEFQVQSNIRDRIELRFVGIESVPRHFDVWLLDKELDVSQNLRARNSYDISGRRNPRTLSLIVGRSDFFAVTNAEQVALPASFELDQNFPNPFNPATSIRYGLPEDGEVVLKIYNLLGAEVASLVDGFRQRGFHIAVWDGRNQDDEPVASGVYVYRLSAKQRGVLETRKMVLIK